MYVYVMFVTTVCVLVVCCIDGCSSVNTESYPRISVGNKSQRHAVIRQSDTHRQRGCSDEGMAEQGHVSCTHPTVSHRQPLSAR